MLALALSECLLSFYSLCVLFSHVYVYVCSDCSGVLSIIGVAEAEAAKGSQEGGTSEEGEGETYLRFEYECLRECPSGQTQQQVAGSPTPICFGKQLTSPNKMYACITT